MTKAHLVFASMKKLVIKGTVHYNDLETGFWTITDGKGKIWRIDGMPVALRKENLKVKANCVEINEEMSIFMFGTAVKIVDYEII